MESKEIANKIIYWALCTILIIFLFLLIGVVAFVINEKGLKIESFIALLFGIIGSILVIISLYKPFALFGLAKPPFEIKEESLVNRISIFHVAYGFSFLIGGICYLAYSNLLVLLFFLLLPVAIIQAINFLRK